ncbi:MAG TPA: FtsX-like permease family protein [Gemmataceae bacterium]|nr:FtsX-like permease family protein [Gemmataceae bacterium]
MLALHRSLSVGYLRLHPTRAMLIVLSIALGVATLVATRMLNGSINSEAPAAVNPMAKLADLVIMNAQTGVPRALAEEIQKAQIRGVSEAEPIVLGRITLPQLDKYGRSVWLFGLDWNKHASGRDAERRDVRSHAEHGNAEFGEGIEIHWIHDPTAASGASRIVLDRLRGRIPVLAGDKLALTLAEKAPSDSTTFHAIASSKRSTLSLVGTVHFPDLNALNDGNFLVMDVGDAAGLIFPQRKENVSQINIRIEAGADRQQVRQRLLDYVGDRAEVRTLESNYEAVRDVTGGLELGFDIGGAIALVVGLFLVYNVLSVSVAERRHDIGIMRSVGATRGQVARLFLGEAAVLGLVGSGLGLPMGWGLGWLTLRPLLGFLSEVFVPMGELSLQVAPSLLGVALLAGVGTAMLAALIPALQAASEEPAAAVRRVPHNARLRHRLLHIASILFLVLAGVACVAGREYLPRRAGVFAGAVILFIASLTIIPLATELMGRLFGPIVRSFAGLEGRLAADNLVRSPGRTGIVIAALAATAALVFGLSAFIHSTKQTVYNWLEDKVAADVFVTCGGSLDAASLTQPMDSHFRDKLKSLPDVEAAVGVRFHLLDFRDRIVFMLAFDTDAFAEGNPRTGRTLAHNYPSLREGGRALVSENFAALYNVHLGDSITVRGRNGPLTLEVIGIIVDYTWNRGTILVDRAWFNKVYGDDSVDIWDVYLRSGANSKAVRDEIIARWGREEALYASTSKQMHDSIEKGIDRVYLLGYAQFFIVGLVTLLGVVSALFISVLQRRRELGLLRAVGASRGQVLGTVLAEAALMGLFGALLGFVVGLFIEWYTIRLILPDETGFVFPMLVPWKPAAVVFGLAVVLAALVGLWPAYHATRLRIAEAIAYE